MQTLLVERARMEKEYIRTKSFLPYANRVRTLDPRNQFIMWREFGEERDKKCLDLQQRIDEACERARNGIEDIEIGYFDQPDCARATFYAVLNSLEWDHEFWPRGSHCANCAL